MSMITFADNKSFEVVAVNGRYNMTTSVSDIITDSNRNIFEIIFDGNIVAEEDVKYYYLNPNNASTIIITDDSGNQYTHLDYVISVKFSKEYVNDKVKITLILAQLTEVDKTLRNLSGDKNYVGTELEVAIAKKVDELSDICTQTIYDGADVTLADGTVEHFTLDEQDQLNLSGVGLELLMGEEIVSWHEDDETIACKFYSAADATTIIKTLTANKKYHITYFRDLRIYVNTLATVEEVNAIEYGFALPDEFKSEVLMAYEQRFNMGS